MGVVQNVKLWMEAQHSNFFWIFVSCYGKVLPFNPLNAELNPIRHLLALIGARHIVHVSRGRVKIHRITGRLYILG